MRNNGDPAIEVLGRDFSFPHKLDGLPARLSDCSGLEIGSFTTNDGVRLSYWQAGEGEPLIFLPGWNSGMTTPSAEGVLELLRITAGR